MQQSTGRALPLFGYNFFSTTTTYRSLDNVPVPDDYVLGPGDEVLLHAWGGVAGDQRLVVDRNGQVSIPGVGVVTVAGARASELDSLLRGGLGRYFTDFNVNAALGRLRSIPVYVVGKAMSPGSYTVPGTSTIIGALFASGGPAFNGSMRAVALYRNGRQIAALDVYGFLTRGAVKDDVHLLPGDVIVIPPAGPRIALTGALDAPGIYELRKTSETLRELLDDAGGVTALTSLDRVMIERVNPADGAAPRSVQEVRLDEAGLATVVKDGDIVTLSMVSQKFSNAVTLRGNVAAALRYPYKPGMTLADLLPSPEAVLTPDYFTRKNILVEYAKSGGADRRPFDGIRNLVDEPNWHYAIIQRLDPVTLTENVIAFNLRAVMTKGSAEAGIALQPGDVVTIFGKRDLRNPVDDNKSLVRVDGEVRAPGVYQLNAGESLRELLQRAGGLTSNAYVFGLEFTRESTRSQQQQNLNAALDRATLQANSKLAAALANLPSGDTQYLQAQMAAAQQAQLARLRELKPTGRVSLELSTRASRIGDLPDLPLNDGDAIYVPPVPAFVTVYGAVDNQNAVIWKLHRTVADTLRVAGVQRDIADLDAAFVLRAAGRVRRARRRARHERALAEHLALLRERHARGDGRVALRTAVEHLLELGQLDLQHGRAHAVVGREHRAAPRQRAAQPLRQQLRGRRRPFAVAVGGDPLRVRVREPVDEAIGVQRIGRAHVEHLERGPGARRGGRRGPAARRAGAACADAERAARVELACRTRCRESARARERRADREAPAGCGRRIRRQGRARRQERGAGGPARRRTLGDPRRARVREADGRRSRPPERGAA